ncbi:MAG: 3-dehydroquinate synthase [Deltaproteobacteria bacterium]|nr:3-dehydroquinate synthase [Deltaproteobacteria bacterium]
MVQNAILRGHSSRLGTEQGLSAHEDRDRAAGGDGEPTSRHLQQVTVEFEYPVYFTRDAFAPANPCLREAIATREPWRRHRLFAVIDRNVALASPWLVGAIHAYVERHHDALELVAEPLVLEGGEAAKNDTAVATRLHTRWNELGMDRQSVIVIVGGGALLDLAGYAAAVAHRGLRVVRLPTSVLAQADSGVGVKCGVNLFGKKNFVGTFAPPFGVVNDGRFLETLAARDVVAGMAEAVKVALIRDGDFFAWLVAHADELAACALGPLGELIQRCAALHLRHIATSGDPFELGSARPLDFGHWAAHKLEAMTRHRLRHGEAVAIGLAIDATYAERSGLCDAATAASVRALLGRLGLPLWDEALAQTAGGRRVVLDGLAEFREHLGGELTITLLRRIGEGVEVHEIRESLMEDAIARLVPARQ